MKTRKSNIELLRIISMILIVLVHSNYFLFGPVIGEEIEHALFRSFGRILFQQLCIIGVNVFVLISGYFGIRPTKKKFFSLMSQIIFWPVLSTTVGLLFGVEVSLKSVAKTFWLGGYYWFVPAYIALFAFSPVLNKFIEHSTKKEFMVVVLSFFVIEFFYGWLGNMASYNSGYSFASFIGLYLLGRYVNLYPGKLCKFDRRIDMLLYFVLSIIPAVISFLTIMKMEKDFATISYSSPFVVFAALFLLLYFTKLNLTSQSINWAAASVFSIYLFHQHPSIVPLFKSVFLKLNCVVNESLLLYILCSIVIAVAGGFIIVCVDKIRVWMWKILVKRIPILS